MEKMIEPVELCSCPSRCTHLRWRQSVSPTVGGSAAFHLEPFLVLWGFQRRGWVLPTPIAPLGAK